MTESLQHTPLRAEHLALRAKMVPFAGYEMPIQYPTGITIEHRAVRTAAGLFDVSHMGEIDLRGPDALAIAQRVSTNDASRIEVGQAQYSAMTDEQGCVLDDLIIYRFEDRWMLVVNAANRNRDFDWISRHSRGYDVEIVDRSDEIGLLALQGPEARAIRWNRCIVALIGVYLFVFGLLYEIQGDAWSYLLLSGSVYLSSMSVLLIACCYWKRANSWGAFGAIIGGAVVPITFLTLEKLSATAELAARIGKDNAGIAAFAAAALGMIVGSLLKPSARPHHA